MDQVGSRELRNHTRDLLNRVASGKEIIITVDGIPMAVLRPIERRPRWISKGEFVERILPRAADPGLRRELRELTPDTTDDLFP